MRGRIRSLAYGALGALTLVAVLLGGMSNWPHL